MRWLLGLFAVLGLLVIGLATAVATGLVDVSSIDPFTKLNAAARPATGPVLPEEQDPEPEAPTESAASLAALQHAGYVDRVVFLSSTDAKVVGPKVDLEDRKSGKSRVDEKNRLPNAMIRNWSSPDDSAEWSFASPKAGKYVVTFDCYPGASSSRGKGIAGGKFLITAGKESLQADVDVDVKGRRGSSSFHLIDVGQITLPAGQATLRISPSEKQTGLLALRSVRLYPAE